MNPASARQVVEPVAPPVAELSGQLQPVYVVAGVVVEGVVAAVVVVVIGAAARRRERARAKRRET